MSSEYFNDVNIIKSKVFKDDRGSFSEIYNKKEFIDYGLNNKFIQDNVSFSKKRGTIRGLHFQNGKFAQGKLLRVLSGEIQDVFIDLRKDSNTFEKHGHEIMNYESGWIYIPKGFAHGFCTLTNNVQVLYKVDSYYSKENELGIRWNDNAFNIKWLIGDEEPTVSSKDNELSVWADIIDEVEF
tara:strand:+ start:2078 stop:2626 length:549 start_codon:yes stop_codon:yes gene_type:complete